MIDHVQTGFLEGNLFACLEEDALKDVDAPASIALFKLLLKAALFERFPTAKAVLVHHQPGVGLRPQWLRTTCLAEPSSTPEEEEAEALVERVQSELYESLAWIVEKGGSHEPD